MSDPRAVTYKWLLGSVVTIVLMGGAGWMTYVQGQLTETRKVQDDARDRAAGQAADIAVIKEQIKTIQKDAGEIKDSQKDTNKKLDELLRRR